MDKALEGVESSIKSNVLDKINSITLTIHRIFQNIPPPPGSNLGDDDGSDADKDAVIPPGLDPTRLFDDLEPTLGPDDAFDFGVLEPIQEENSSQSSYFSDSFQAATNSSNTSVDGQQHPKGSNYEAQGYIVPQEQFTLPPHDPYQVYYQY